MRGAHRARADVPEFQTHSHFNAQKCRKNVEMYRAESSVTDRRTDGKTERQTHLEDASRIKNLTNQRDILIWCSVYSSVAS